MSEKSKKSEPKLKQFLGRLGDNLRTPQLKEGEPEALTFWGASPFERVRSNIDFEKDSRELIDKKLKNAVEESRSEELLAIARAELKLSKESNQKNLIILHHTQLISIAALIVAIFAVIRNR